MKLINLETLKLEEHDDYHAPRYAILSHRWEEQEVLFADWTKSPAKRKPKGHQKIVNFCKVAKEECQVHYGWVDTCCIDKSSSSELSESINSMYRYYKRAIVCIAYLADVPVNTPTFSSDSYRAKAIAAVCESGWFRRGWTLQELIAPSRLVFYGVRWDKVGSLDKFSSSAISQLTGIPTSLLLGQSSPSDYPIAVRMSWASDRETTRPEDQAYSLLGMFDINMPLLYGEGHRAFLRLQEEIVRRSTDHTIFVWNRTDDYNMYEASDLFASSPADFAHPEIQDLVECHLDTAAWVTSFEVNNHGLSISLPLIPCQTHPREKGLGGHIYFHAVLNCRFRKGPGPVALNVKWLSDVMTSERHETEVKPLLHAMMLGKVGGPSKELPCTALHDGRLAHLYEEDLFRGRKIPVTILRHDISSVHKPSIKDDADGLSRRVMIGFTSSPDFESPMRRVRVPRDAWVRGSSIWIADHRGAWITFSAHSESMIGIILNRDDGSDEGVCVTVVELFEDKYVISAHQSQKVRHQRSVGPGCSLLFGLSVLGRVLRIGLQVTQGMESTFMILTCEFVSPLLPRLQDPDVPHQGLVISTPLVESDLEPGIIARRPTIDRPTFDDSKQRREGRCAAYSNHRHKTLSPEEGGALMEAIRSSVFPNVSCIG
ncbi:hypothetical protein LTR56_025174 [Elasticomyces elasticus]|nr:hypothetical protein LTR56_025174 [Elasticomyces elasticus]KAK3621069.1 hypothetical protein LTR22_025354 [Elasticomyces elasticus]KAK4904528.1 hypothetical protein LTR49_026027 [Elasticomyces elasticus]KAK5740848.1 hypothetical protein LTS12_024823 [Elasticomyces elasticus]